jgi:hypothetical protein
VSRWRPIAVLAALTGGLACASVAQAASLEYPVKAAFLYKFGSFVDWPAPAFEGPSAPVVVCVLGRDPFGAQLDQLVRDATIGGRGVSIRRLSRVGPASGCHILYVGGAATQPAAEGLRAVAGAPVLTVTDEAQGGPKGVVHFVVRQNRVRFEIDEAAAARNGLQVSSKLLNLAVAVRPR